MTSTEISAPPVQASGALPRPVFVSAEACLKVLRWDEMVDRLRQAYSVPLSDKVSPPRTVARGERTWIRGAGVGAAERPLHGREGVRHVARQARRLHHRADGSAGGRLRRAARRLLRHLVPHRRDLGGRGRQAREPGPEDHGRARQRLGGEFAHAGAQGSPANLRAARVQPDRGEPRGVCGAHAA